MCVCACMCVVVCVCVCVCVCALLFGTVCALVRRCHRTICHARHVRVTWHLHATDGVGVHYLRACMCVLLRTRTSAV